MRKGERKKRRNWPGLFIYLLSLNPVALGRDGGEERAMVGEST